MPDGFVIQAMGGTGIFGKHPVFGDFIAAGMSKPMQVALEEWLGAVLPRVRDNLGEVWQPFYDIALPLRFWLGEGVVPSAVGGPVAGVMVFSHDKVGRRFPLIALVEAAQMPPPVMVPDQQWYDALQALMLEHDTPETAADLADMFSQTLTALPEAMDSGERRFWAVHTAGEVAAMLTNVAATDHRCAAARRSYWWSTGDASRTATFHSMEGLPDASVFQWLLAGNPVVEPEPETEPEPEPDAPIPEPEQRQHEYEGEPSVIPTSDPWWSGEGARPVPKALYREEPEEEDGPQSPFSTKPQSGAPDDTRNALADEAEKD